VLVLASGPNRVDEGRISAALGERIGKADAAFVREKSGFAIGGVPPLGHTESPATFLDEDLLKEDEVWAAAGHTHVVFGLRPEELRRVTAARTIRVK
jgi:prolyl-tRNA editing enzyme YbaK/EbsC (Cys-tRNA(Pro) deacylase)